MTYRPLAALAANDADVASLAEKVIDAQQAEISEMEGLLDE